MKIKNRTLNSLWDYINDQIRTLNRVCGTIKMTSRTQSIDSMGLLITTEKKVKSIINDY